MHPINASRFQVKVPTGDCVVDFKQMKCTCRRFDVHKIPCLHAIAAVKKNIFVVGISSKSSLYKDIFVWRICREYFSDRKWLPPPEIAVQKCLPPIVRKRTGRPKKRRYETALENATKAKRPRKKHTCSNCGLPGHNRNTCES